MRNLFSYFIIIVVSITIAGCGGRKTVKGDLEVGEVISGTTGDVSTSGLDDSNTSSSGLDDGSVLGTAAGLGETDGLLGKRVVYFDYNSSSLTFESDEVVQAHAQYLASSPGLQIILEGHADERGTREYNLALGEDRAKAVANVMEALGVSSGRIQIVSYGEERPVALGYDEAAFALNRRVEILYQ